MARCTRCDGYVSRDYARVFGDNQDCVTSCPDCRAGWEDGEEEGEEQFEPKLTFRMSDFETDERSPQNDEIEVSERTPPAGRFGRVGKAVSGLF